MASKNHLKNFKVAIVQASPVLLDKEKTIEKIRELTKKAAAEDAKLVVFPESFIPAYPRGTTFGIALGQKRTPGLEYFNAYFDNSIEIPSPEITSLEAIARQNNVYLVVGITEREGGTLYCTVIFFSPEGKYMGKHRKLLPTAAERIVWGCGDGSTLPIFDTPLGKMGAVICWENYMPLLRTTMYGKGIQIYLALTADARETWVSSMRHIAREGRCFVLSVNQFVKPDDLTSQNIDLDKWVGQKNYDTEKRISCLGGSCIIDPLGRIIGGPNYDGECIITAELNMEDLTEGKLYCDAVGHYSRPDVFTLYVNEEAQSSVVLSGKKEECVRDFEKLRI